MRRPRLHPANLRNQTFTRMRWMIPVLLLLLPHVLIAQEEPTTAERLVREETGRFMGYEDVLWRYLTLPFDLATNSNVQGNYADIGFLLIAFLPLLLLWACRRKAWLFWLILLVELFLLGLYYLHSPVLGAENEMLQPSQLSSATVAPGAPPASGPLYFLTSELRMMLCGLFGCEGPATAAGQSRSAIAYPVMIAGFLALLVMIISLTAGRSMRFRKLLVFSSIYLFMWLILGAGIIWYALIGLALAHVFLIPFVERIAARASSFRIVSYIFMALAAIWILMAWNLKYTNLYYSGDDPNLMVDFPVLQYHSGQIDFKELQDNYFKNLSVAMEEINRSEGYVYRAGTMFPYFVEESNRRLFDDNQLGFFGQLRPEFERKEDLAEALKASGFEYILLGLNIGAFDQTPEQSLKKRFNEFLSFLYNNNRLELVATDRITSAEDGRQFFSVFGEIVNPGSYAVYRIK